MRAKATRNKFEDYPAMIAALGSSHSDIYITKGEEYEVYALSVFEGIVFLQIINDVNIITWLPAWFFEMREASMPSDWICCLLGTDLQMVLGPKFIAADESTYRRMVELDPEPVARFWARLNDKPSFDE